MSHTQDRLRFVAINGSYRREGNGTDLLEHARDVLAREGVDLDIIQLGDHDIRGCGPCGDCNARTTPCQVRDATADIVDTMASSDGVIFCAPVQGFGLGSKMQAFIERAGVGHLRFDRRLTNKVGLAIVVGRRYSHMSTYNHLVDNLLLNRMIVIGAGFPPIFYGNHPGEALLDEEGIEMLDRALRRMAGLAHVLDQHRTHTGTDVLAEVERTERDDRWFAKNSQTSFPTAAR